MNKSEIKQIIAYTIDKFPYKIKKPDLLFLSKRKFIKYLNDTLLENHPNKTPCFVAHLPENNCLCFCISIIKKLTANMTKEEQVLFIEAITLHELYHIYNAERIETSEDAVKSEMHVHNELKRDFPKHAWLIEKLS